LTHLRQAPAPSQVPSWPHVATSLAAHSLASVGWAPAGTCVHSPGALGRLQAMHVPSQAVAQQTPSAQTPLAHSAPQAQALEFTLVPGPVTPLHVSGGAALSRQQ
jgi:hypothetical protein